MAQTGEHVDKPAYSCVLVLAEDQLTKPRSIFWLIRTSSRSCNSCVSAHSASLNQTSTGALQSFDLKAKSLHDTVVSFNVVVMHDQLNVIHQIDSLSVYDTLTQNTQII